MVYDTPFALDAKFKPQPQMVGDYSISPDKLLYSFTLRDGLKISRRRAGSAGPTVLCRCSGGCYAIRSASHWQRR